MGKNFLVPGQVEDLTFIGWQVNAGGFFIDLYRDDFINESDFEDICNVSGVDPDGTNSITILCFGVQSDNK
jgi:hypothetical protein